MRVQREISDILLHSDTNTNTLPDTSKQKHTQPPKAVNPTERQNRPISLSNKSTSAIEEDGWNKVEPKCCKKEKAKQKLETMTTMIKSKDITQKDAEKESNTRHLDEVTNKPQNCGNPSESSRSPVKTVNNQTSRDDIAKCYNLCRRYYNELDPEVKKYFKNEMKQIYNQVSSKSKWFHDKHLLQRIYNIAPGLDPNYNLYQQLEEVLERQ